MITVVVPTHNAADRTRATVERFLQAAHTSGDTIEVIVVDDGSNETERNALNLLCDGRIRIIRNDINLGRAGARNIGAKAAKGRWLLIVDCDCPPAAGDFFFRHMQALKSGAHVSVGPLLSRRDDFWGKYQDSATARRQDQVAAGRLYVLTSANIFMGATWFKQIGGFDERYRKYGFEDRDFFLRLIAAGARISCTDRAGVIHEDDQICLASIAPKMRDAGEFTAHLFSRDHPEAYKILGYAAIDARLHPGLRFVAMTMGRLSVAIAPFLDRWLERLPFPIARTLVKLTSGLAFMYGTARGHKLERNTSS